MGSKLFRKLPFPSVGKADRAGIGMGPMLDLIAPFGDFGLITQDYVFMGDTVPDELNVTTNNTAAAVNAGGDGVGLDLVTGTDTEGHASVSSALGWDGDRGLLAEFWLKLPATITTMKFECGVIDHLTNIGAVNSKGSATATATDYGVFIRDTADDTVLAFHSAEGGSVVATEGLVTPVGSDFLYFAVRVLDDNVQAWYAVGSATPDVHALSQVGHGGANGINGASALSPWVMAQARTGGQSRTLSLRRMRITGAFL